VVGYVEISMLQECLTHDERERVMTFVVQELPTFSIKFHLAKCTQFYLYQAVTRKSYSVIHSLRIGSLHESASLRGRSVNRFTRAAVLCTVKLKKSSKYILLAQEIGAH